MWVLILVTFSFWDGSVKQRDEIATFKTKKDCMEASEDFRAYSRHKAICVPTQQQE